MAHPADPHANRLLSALPPADRQRWQPLLEPVDLKAGQVVHEQGRMRTHAYFPTSAVFSLVYMLENGARTEVAHVGREGFVGASMVLGGGATTTCNGVLIAGQAFRISAQDIRNEFERSAAVRHLCLRYIQALATQIAQTAVCNCHHSIDQQVCGWLLHCLDRLQGSELTVTHDVIGSMLGVRRESVTQVARHLQASGLIRYGRGHIEVLDRSAIERRACECHAVVKAEYDRLLRPVPASPLTDSNSEWLRTSDLFAQ